MTIQVNSLKVNLCFVETNAHDIHVLPLYKSKRFCGLCKVAGSECP